MTVTKSIFLCCFLLLLGCAEKEIIMVAGSGTLEGYVTGYSASGLVHPTQSGVVITVEGSDPPLFAETDAAGRFSISGVKTGTYDLVLTKAGFCTSRYQSFSFVGGGEPLAVELDIRELPDFSVEDVNVEIFDYAFSVVGRITVTTNIPAGDFVGVRRVRYFMGTSADISYSKYAHTDVYYFYNNNSTLTIQIPIDTTKFPRGSTLYVAVYPASDESLSFLDLETGLSIYTSLNQQESATGSFPIPSN